MKKRLLSLALGTMMVLSTLAGCGSKDGGSATVNTKPEEQGKVLNIYCWNEEFKTRLTDHYPGYEEVDGTTGKIGDITVKWNITPSDDNAYQNNLDETLLKQADAAADDKIDLFLIEADYALKYVDTDYTMPVKDLVMDMEGDEPCEKIRKIAEGLPYRDFVTVGLLVNKLNLKNQTGRKTLGDIVPDCWIYVQDKGVKLGRIQIFNNWSPYLVKDPENTVWIGLEYFCAEGDDFWNMSDEQCVAFAEGELVKMGVISSGEVLDSHRERIKKAYPAYFDTYKHFDRMISFLNKYENLFCIGRNGQHRYNNMDHSMLTAIYAARSIKNGNADKSDIWNVNTEKEYHEQKSE